MSKYGVFISHRHADWILAGRIYDILNQRGFHPFLDAGSMRQGDFHETLATCVKEAPYFLLVLTEHTFQNVDPEDFIYKEIKTALETKGKKFLLLAEQGFQFPRELPQEISGIQRYHCYECGRTNFLDVLNRICQDDIKPDVLKQALDWRLYTQSHSGTFLSSRKNIERDFASLGHRFGMDRVRCIQDGKPYHGENHIHFVHLSCYAAGIIFTPTKNMVDEQAYDRGLMFNILANLLDDEEFSLEVVINAPGCWATTDAISNQRLGNSALEAYPEAIYLSSYCTIQQLIREDPIFRKAYQERRFRFMVTEKAMPYSLFQIEYKPGYEEYNHIKVDIYSEGIISNMDRRCMVIFQKDDPDNYSFFQKRYQYFRNVKESRALIAANHDRWMHEWDQLKEEMNE